MKKKCAFIMSIITLSMTMLCSAAEAFPEAASVISTPENRYADIVEFSAAGEEPAQIVELPAAAEEPVQIVELPTDAEEPAQIVEFSTNTEEAPAATIELPTDAEEPAQIVELPTDAEDPAQDAGLPAPTGETNVAVGEWEKAGMDGEWLDLPGTSSIFYLYPDGTICSYDNVLQVSAELAEDGSFTVDTSESEELAAYTVTGKVSPVSQESMEQFKVNADAGRFQDSDNARQLIVTITYPDPRNPLSDTPVTTQVFFLHKARQATFVKNWLYNKVWKAGGHTLSIDPDGGLDLDDGANTGTLAVYNREEDPLYIPAELNFSWGSTGKARYTPVLFTSDSIYLQNNDKPGETLILEYEKDYERPVPGEEANGFIGEWEMENVYMNNVEINASDLLECDSVTAQITEDWYVSLEFSSGYSIVLDPVYEDGLLQVKYNRPGYNMDWTVELHEDGTATAAYDSYRITFTKKS